MTFSVGLVCNVFVITSDAAQKEFLPAFLSYREINGECCVDHGAIESFRVRGRGANEKRNGEFLLVHNCIMAKHNRVSHLHVVYKTHDSCQDASVAG